MITEEMIKQALSNVFDPELKKDLITLGMVKDIRIDGSTVSFELELTTPACPLKAYLESESRKAVKTIPEVGEVKITISSRVPSDGRPRGLLKLPVHNVIAVASGKGGVGKSTVAVNLAVALAQFGARVGLLDADIYGPNIPTMMGLKSLPMSDGEKIIPAESYGVKTMSIGFLVKPGQPLIWRGPMLHSAIRQFLGDVEWGELDYLIIDLPPGTGDAQLSLAQSVQLSGAVIVTMPQLVSIEDAARCVQMFCELDIPVLGVVENMSYLDLPDGSRMELFGKGGGETLAKNSGVPFLGGIPIDPRVRQGGDEGQPVASSTEMTPVKKAFFDIASSLAAQLSISALTRKES